MPILSYRKLTGQCKTTNNFSTREEVTEKQIKRMHIVKDVIYLGHPIFVAYFGKTIS